MRKPMIILIAIAVLLLAGGAWWWQRQQQAGQQARAVSLAQAELPGPPKLVTSVNAV